MTLDESAHGVFQYPLEVAAFIVSYVRQRGQQFRVGLAEIQLYHDESPFLIHLIMVWRDISVKKWHAVNRVFAKSESIGVNDSDRIAANGPVSYIVIYSCAGECW